MKAVRLDAPKETLLDPDAREWAGLEKLRLDLQPTLLVLQPSEYVQNKWANLQHGLTTEVRVAAAHNGESIFFRLEWDDPVDDSRPSDMADFPDQCGVMLPITDDAPITEMGLSTKPVNMWLWRADVETPYYVTARGRGTSLRYAESPLAGRGVWRDRRWQVVIARPFHVSLPARLIVPLAPGMKHKCTFAVWQGSNKERAGLKAYQPLWQPLEIEA